MNIPKAKEPQSLPTNYLMKQQLYKEYKFPKNTATMVIVKASPSGIGYQTKYEDAYAPVIGENEFLAQSSEVESGL